VINDTHVFRSTTSNILFIICLIIFAAQLITYILKMLIEIQYIFNAILIFGQIIFALA
jgi:hypothetical protein